ncbi:TPA: N-acetylmuramoyl-L-alanine amidase [Bacillus cereus]|nr:N-acetylmuramoyl-L-alanine amidase [Bacillus cereus]
MAGSVDVGLGFTIDAKISVNGSYQYKVHNSPWQVFYITASDTYVNVR